MGTIWRCVQRVAFLVLVACPRLLYADVDWIPTGAAAWETPGNWLGGAVPSIGGGSIARVLNGGTAEITVAGQNTAFLTLAVGSGQSGYVHLISGSLQSSSVQNLCRAGLAAFTQEAFTTNTVGGSVTIGEQSGSQGTYYLNGGWLYVPNSDIYVGYNAGATGTIQQAGGVLGCLGSASKQLYLGFNAGAVGNYVMNGGIIALTNNNYGSVGQSGTGHFTQNNGSITGNRDWYIGKNAGAYGDQTMANGTFLVYWPYVGFNAGSTGVVTMTGGTFQGGQNLSVGQAGKGTFYQSGGTVGVTNEYLYIGKNTTGVGAYYLSGSGQLLLTNANNFLYVGFDGNGTLIQSNGTVQVANYLFVGKGNGGGGAVGLYRIENGSVYVGQNLVLGEQAAATGTVQVVGSAATLNAKAYQQNANSTLSVQLDGGGLSPINVTNTATLNGTLTIGASVQVPYNTTVTVINAGGLAGRFSATNFVAPLTGADVIYDVANGDVKLTHFVYPPPIWQPTGTGAWETGANWGGAVPALDAYNGNAVINNGGTAEITTPGQAAQSLTVGTNAAGSGTVHLIAGTLQTSGSEIIGQWGAGQVTQESGTTNRVSGTLTVGEQSGARGTYQLNGGTLAAPNSTIYAGRYAGATGTIAQAGGVVEGPGSQYLNLGYTAGSVGNYLMTGGNLNLTNTTYAAVGYYGTGHVVQSNGAVSCDQQFNIGKESGASGDYTMSGGSFYARLPVLGEKSGGTGVLTISGGTFLGGDNLKVGQLGNGAVVQSGGVVGVTNQYLFLGEEASGVGSYTLSGSGQLLLTNAANFLYVGNYGRGTFTQSNGIVRVANYLIISKYAGANGRYRIENGSLTVDSWLEVGENAAAAGAMDVVGSLPTIGVNNYSQTANSTLSVTVDAGGLSPISVTNSALLNGTLRVDASVAVPYSATVTVINAGGLTGRFSATNFVAPLTGADVIYDVANGDVKLTHFQYPQPIWQPTWTDAWETATNWNGVVPSIDAYNGNAQINNGGTADITQAGQAAQSLTLAWGPAEAGSVHLIAGSLESSGFQTVGRGGTGVFTQEAGTTNRSGSTLTVGEQSGANGHYGLNGGRLQVLANDLIVGNIAGATGTVTQAGGDLQILGASKYLYLGYNAGAVGNYVLNGGNVNLTNSNYAAIGYFGTGHVVQNNGSLVCDQQFNIGKESGAAGDYTINNGSFLARWPVIGEKSGANGTVTVTGGQFLGGYNLSVGQFGQGAIIQSGGTVSVTNQYLFLGEAASGVGSYTLSGTGELLVTNSAGFLYVGYNGHGTLTQSNGTVRVANDLFVGKNNGAVGLYRVAGGTAAIGRNLILGEGVTASGTLQVVGTNASLQAAGYYAQNAASTLALELATNGVSAINVTGSATLNGTLSISGESLGYNETVTVINAGSLAGRFSVTNVVLPLTSVDVVYDTANGDLKLTHFIFFKPTTVFQFQ
ncbi:MAG: hypothetical protein K8T26_06400 [Lentisphaerae bacterium]|nr:hypothetical protein [Lentisphaerota bacterium]